MPTKKKYNARFAPARIKKIMQTDEEVGKVSAAVPVLISKALEMFLDDMMKKADLLTKNRNSKTLTVRHLKQCIMEEKKFDFLHDTVAAIPDLGPDEEEEESKEKQPRKRRKQTDRSNGKKNSASEHLSEGEDPAPEDIFTALISTQSAVCERRREEERNEGSEGTHSEDTITNGPSTSQSSSHLLYSRTLERSQSETNPKPSNKPGIPGNKPGIRSFSIDSIMNHAPFPNLPDHKKETSDDDYDA